MVPVFLLALAATAAPLRRHGGGPSGLSDPLWALKRARHFVPVPGRATAPSEATYARHGRPESGGTALWNGQRALSSRSLGRDWAYSRVRERAAHGLKGLHGAH